ncbi:MAG: UDP-N-acetylmuramate dehydrogenase [Treponema sp.]|jgi:UDP-N-acetylmuramate dehydrogenase|nr:UDP-N-acetylmuramate dehydrogenase [Treponema sp.]
MDLHPFMEALKKEAERLALDFGGPGGGEAALTLDYRFDEPMDRHTSFKVGGPADLWLRPGGELFPPLVNFLLRRAGEEEIPVFILGGGSNLVVSDRGIRGIVLDTGGWTGIKREGEGLYVRSGTSVKEMTEFSAARNLGGLEFLAGMPGTLGGALWMNARCYETSLSDILIETEILDAEAGSIRRIGRRPGDFGYKKSPFQDRRTLILGALLAVSREDGGRIRRKMEDHLRDRELKGHYRRPSAGSVFKNNRSFGKPAGQIIDELGLKGLRLGDAQVAPWHGNIIINLGSASAVDIRSLTELVAARVEAGKGIALEREILFAGEWENS